MEALQEPDVRATLGLVRDLQDASDAAAVRAAVLRRLPELVDHFCPGPDKRERLLALRLTPRERQVLERVAAGDANLVIARRLRVSPRTVEKHLEHAYAKLGVTSRTAALARLREITD